MGQEMAGKSQWELSLGDRQAATSKGRDKGFVICTPMLFNFVPSLHLVLHWSSSALLSSSPSPSSDPRSEHEQVWRNFEDGFEN